MPRLIPQKSPTGDKNPSFLTETATEYAPTKTCPAPQLLDEGILLPFCTASSLHGEYDKSEDMSPT
jgi:hypothetical protein